LRSKFNESFLSQGRKPRKSDSPGSTPTGRISVLPSRNIFKPRLRRWDYADLAFAVKPWLAKSYYQTRLCLRIYHYPNEAVAVLGVRYWSL
jgi:hypothetical protein